MSSVNKVILVGNLGADPEVRTFQSGGKIANLRIATSEHWTDRASGERRERTEWHSVVIRAEGLVGVAERFLKKGAKVYVEGQLMTRKWQDQAGADRYSTEVVLSGPRATLVMLDGASGSGRGAAAQGHAAEESARWGGSQGTGGGGAAGGAAGGDGFEDDEIPF